MSKWLQRARLNGIFCELQAHMQQHLKTEWHASEKVQRLKQLMGSIPVFRQRKPGLIQDALDLSSELLAQLL